MSMAIAWNSPVIDVLPNEMPLSRYQKNKPFILDLAIGSSGGLYGFSLPMSQREARTPVTEITPNAIIETAIPTLSLGS